VADEDERRHRTGPNEASARRDRARSRGDRHNCAPLRPPRQRSASRGYGAPVVAAALSAWLPAP
jgi:hypothetical protein